MKEEERKNEEEKARKQNRGDCRRRLRGVYDLFWKMVPQKAALKIQQHESYTTHTHRRKQWNSHSHNHKYTHTHVNIRTYIPAREQGRKGKERKSKTERERSGAGLGEVTNNKYTHTQAKMWEKRLNENYFKLFRKREKGERKGGKKRR